MSYPKMLVIVGVLATSVMIFAAEREKSTPHNDQELGAMMRAKLASSQKVVEGLMAADFDLIRKGGAEMSKICVATEWRAEDDQVYAHYRSELRRTAQKLISLAEEKNLDGAAYTYMHSIQTCISCHDYCRGVLHVAVQTPSLQATPNRTNVEEVGKRNSPLQRR